MKQSISLHLTDFVCLAALALSVVLIILHFAIIYQAFYQLSEEMSRSLARADHYVITLAKN